MLNARALCLTAVLSVLLSGPVPADNSAPRPLTAAEVADWTVTTSHQEVVAFLHDLQRRSPHIRLETLLRSAEGREVPLVILGDPLPETPAAAQADPRPVVFIQANIHADEVSGKEAVLQLLRDVLLEGRQHILRQLILLVAPNFNADGNERVDPAHRRYVPNPEGGVGVRHTSANLDLNRDYAKLDTPEVRSVLERVLLPWDPLMTIDLHDTNGSYHHHTVTWLAPRAPGWAEEVSGFTWGRLFPDLSAALAAREILTLPYGNFGDRRDPARGGWVPVGHSPRYGMDYVGLRNRFSILLEMYAHAPYRVRVDHCRAFLEETLRLLVEHGPVMRELARQADRLTAANAARPVGEREAICLRHGPAEAVETLRVEGYEYEVTEGAGGRPMVRPRPGTRRVYEVPFLAGYPCAESRPTPWAYLLAPGCREAVERLLRHGVRVERLTGRQEWPVEQFHTGSLTVDPWVNQGHSTVAVTGQWVDVGLTVDEGWFLVPMTQPLARLVGLLLEPEGPDSLVTWNAFNSFLTRQWSRDLPPLPIYRVMTPRPVASRRATPADLGY